MCESTVHKTCRVTVTGKHAYLYIFYHVLWGLCAAQRDNSERLHEAVEDLLFCLVVFRRQRQHRGTGDDKEKDIQEVFPLLVALLGGEMNIILLGMEQLE